MILHRFRHKVSSYLQRLERKTEIGLRPFIKGWSWLFSGQMFSSGAAILLALGYAHFLPQDVYGTFKYVLSILSILTIFSLPGMADASQRAVARGKDGIFWETFKKRIQWGTVGALAAIAVAIYYHTQGNAILAAIFAASAPFLIFFDTLSHFNSLLMGRQLFKEASIWGSSIQIGASVAVFIAVFFSNDVIIILLSYLTTFIVLRGVAFIYVIRRHKLSNDSDDESIRYGKHVSIINVMGMTAGHVDSILLWHSLGATPLAIYAFAQAGADQMRKMFKLVTTSMAFPKFSAQNKDLLRKKLPKKVLLTFAVTIPLAGILVLITPFIYTILFPPYIDSIPYAQAFVAMLAFAPLRFFSTAINAVAPIRSIYILSAIGSVSRICLLLLAIPLFGIWGAVLALFAQQVISDLAAIYLFRKI